MVNSNERNTTCKVMMSVLSHHSVVCFVDCSVLFVETICLILCGCSSVLYVCVCSSFFHQALNFPAFESL